VVGEIISHQTHPPRFAMDGGCVVPSMCHPTVGGTDVGSRFFLGGGWGGGRGRGEMIIFEIIREDNIILYIRRILAVWEVGSGERGPGGGVKRQDITWIY
jgi:hypothetical protein